MPILTKTTAKTLFETGDRPSETDFSITLDSIVFQPSSGGALELGLVEVVSTATSIGRAAGTVGIEILGAETTASAQGHLGGGTVGIQIFEAITSASAQQLIVATASNTVFGIIETATSAEAEAGTAIDRAMTPATMSSVKAALPRGSQAGGILSNGTDATNDIDVTDGAWRDAADAANLVWSTAIGKQIDVTWASGGTTGTPTGGMSSSLHPVQNDTCYHVILGLVSGTVEIGFDTSVTGANLVNDHSFTNTRRMSSVWRLTAANMLFDQEGDEVLIKNPPLDIDLSNTLTTSARLDALTVPIGVKVHAIINAWGRDTGAAWRAYISSPDANDEAPSDTAAPLSTLAAQPNDNSTMIMQVRTDTSGQIRSRASIATVDVYKVSTLGWIDTRGRDD